MKKIPRPLGCDRTISSRHIPAERMIGTGLVEFYCQACGKIDDTGKFLAYLYPKKLDDKDWGKLKGEPEDDESWADFYASLKE